MATLSRGDSRRLYSWWWDSHISPKNSKWLQENLTEMDFKVKTMVKLVEEDADSFTRRAEMYYKKRPELMKLVEEFYRAYRALAERYDHAKGALRQAHKSMLEAFPNEVPSFDEGSPAPSLFGDTQPNSPTMSPRRLSVDTKQKEVLVSPAPSDTAKTSAATSDDSETLTGKKGSKKFNEILSKFSGNTVKTVSGLGKEGKEPPSKFSCNKAKKDSDNEKEDKKDPPLKFSWNKAKKDSDTEKDKKEPLRDKSNSRDRPRQKEDEGAVQKAQKLEEEISRLSAENKILKSQVKTESKTSTSAESELQWLRKAYAKLEPEKEEALAQFQQSLRRVRALEAEIEKFKRQNAELEADINKVEGNHGKVILFEKRKQSLELETSKLKQKNKDQQDEISRKQKDLDQLKVSMEDEHMRCLHVEAALESLKKLHSQSEEVLRVSQLEIKDKVKLLRQTEVKKQSLEKELQRVSEELANVDRRTATSCSTIKGLQDEISHLEEAKEKLECEAQQYIDAKRAVDEELCALKKETDDLKRAHKSITDQIKAVGLNEESLQASVKELQDENSELKDICKRKEEENALLMEKLERLQELSSHSSLLETSLSEANIELDGLREKLEALEESCKTLQAENSSLESEKNELVSRLGIVASKVEELSEKNALLEDSLSEAVAEVQELRQSLNTLDESCQSLQEDKSNLQAEKNTLLSKVELMGHNLEDLTRRIAELNGKHSYLEKESNLKDVQLAELQDLFRMKKLQYEAFTDYSNARVASLEDQIRRLNEGGKSKDEELEDEHLRVLATEMEIFILEASLSNVNERNLNLSREWQRMEQYICEQQKKEETLMDQIGLLRKELHGIWSALNNNEQLKKAEGSEELIFQLVLGKIKEMQHSIDTMKHERKGLLNEKSVLVSLLQELGHQMSDLRSDRGSFYDDHRSKSEALSSLKVENWGLIENNEKLKKDSEAVQHREEKLEDEKRSLSQQALELKDAQLRSQAEKLKLLEDNELLLTKLSELRDEIHTLEDEYAAVFLKTTVLDTLSSIFEKFKDERIIDPKNLDDELIFSRKVGDNFEKALGEIAEMPNTAESGRSRLRTLTMKLEGCRDQLTVLAVDMSMAKTVNEELNEQIEQLNHLLECRKELLEQKDTKLLEADEQVKVLLEQNAMLHGNIEGIKLEFSEVKSMRDQLERKITTLLAIMPNKDTRHAHEENKMPNKESVLDEQNEELRMKRQEMTLSLLNEISSCEEEVAALCAELQTANVRAAIFEEKVLELMQVCESLEVRNLAEREAFNEKLNSKDAFILELNAKLEGLEGANGPMKVQLREYMNVVSSLGQSISSLEDLILPLGNRREVQNDYMVRVARKRGNVGRRDGPSGILQLQKLLAKVEVLREVLVEYGGSRVGIRPGRIAATTESKPSTSREEDLKMKDIELDYVSDSSKFDLESSLYSTLDGDTMGSDDRMPELWEVPKSSSDFFKDWNKQVIGRLSSDAKKLVDLKTSADELKIKMEKSDGDNLPKGFEYDTVKMQLQSAEENILKLVETNKRLIKKAESISVPPVGNIDGVDEANLRSKRQVTLHVRRGSDKIGRLELELQKLEYILLKIEEDCENHRKEAAKPVPLKDYLYGKKERRRKRDHFCGCFGSKEPAVNK